jgi:hypothetical protein
MQLVWTVDAVETIDTGDHARLLSTLASMCPVVVNLYLFANQVDFFESHHLLVSGAGYRDRVVRAKGHDGDSDIALMAKRPA